VSLVSAIMLYASQGNGYGCHSYYATTHPVEFDDNGAPVIQAGQPVDIANLKSSLSKLLGSAQNHSGVLPDNILSVGIEHIVWWQKPGKRTMFFDCAQKGEGVVNVGKRTGVGFTPGLVFVAKGQKMMVFAIKGDERPEADTVLHHAPFMNVWIDGRVCTGSAPLPGETVATSVAAWESAFWLSNFSHPNHVNAVKYKGGIHQFSIDLLDGKFKKFPERVLKPIKEMTLGKLINKLGDDD
jgi:PRTRC genetic system protein B